MSCIYFLASDAELTEVGNPFVSYSNGRAILSNSSSILHPRIFHVDKKEYEQFPVTKKFVVGLDFSWNEETVGILIRYIQEHLAEADEMELLGIWLGGNKQKKTLSQKVLFKQLNYKFLDSFFDDATYEDCYDIKKLTIRNRFY